MTGLLSGIVDLRVGVRAGALVVALAGALLVPAPPALAASGTFGCADLQAGLDQAVSGDVITLNELCTKDNSGERQGSFELPSGRTITLQGTTGAGFDGAGAVSRVLTGHDVGSTVIAGLIFRNSVAPTGLSGGAVLIDGNSAPTFQSDQFYSNGADALGGAVAVLAPAASSGTVVFANSVVGSRSGGEGNHATSGGALYIQSPRRVEVRSNLFAGNAAGDTGGAVGVSSSSEVLFASNLVEGNSAAGGGGGVQLCCGPLTITSNAFRANKVDDPAGTFPVHRGGGLLATSSESGGPGHTVQRGNVFDQNSVSFANSSASGGGGEYLIGSSLDSRNDLFLTNAVQGPAGGGESRGAGLRSTDCNGELLTKVENGVFVGNVLGAAGAGAAVSVTCGSGVNHLSLLDTTVAGNATPDGAAALDGGGADTVLAANSIVVGAGPPLGGFGSQTVTHSDVCDPASQPFPGDANICADPRLVNPSPGSGNFHETPSSPTIDAGANTLLAGDLTVDADGDARAQDGNGDGEAVVDMGADESPAVPLIPPQERPKPPVVGPDVPGPAPPVVEVITKPNKVNRVVYVRIVISKKRGRYLATRISGTRSKARIRLRLLDGRHRSHSVTRTVRTNRPITLRNLPLVGVKLIRVSVIK
jgi:hypothetical protein